MTKRGEEMQAELLAVLRRHRAPLPAYDGPQALRSTSPKTAQPTIYNTVAAVSRTGCFHRVISFKACITCQCDRHTLTSILSLYDDCEKVENRIALDLLEGFSGFLQWSGFAPRHDVIDLHCGCAAPIGGQVSA